MQSLWITSIMALLITLLIAWVVPSHVYAASTTTDHQFNKQAWHDDQNYAQHNTRRTEGQGYGMLFVEATNDQQTFNHFVEYFQAARKLAATICSFLLQVQGRVQSMPRSADKSKATSHDYSKRALLSLWLSALAQTSVSSTKGH